MVVPPGDAQLLCQGRLCVRVYPCVCFPAARLSTTGQCVSVSVCAFMCVCTFVCAFECSPPPPVSPGWGARSAKTRRVPSPGPPNGAREGGEQGRVCVSVGVRTYEYVFVFVYLYVCIVMA